MYDSYVFFRVSDAHFESVTKLSHIQRRIAIPTSTGLGNQTKSEYLIEEVFEHVTMSILSPLLLKIFASRLLFSFSNIKLDTIEIT